MGAVRAGATEFAIVVTVVAVGAENLVTHHPAASEAIEVQHVGKQAGLRQGSVGGVGDRMA